MIENDDITIVLPRPHPPHPFSSYLDPDTYSTTSNVDPPRTLNSLMHIYRLSPKNRPTSLPMSLGVFLRSVLSIIKRTKQTTSSTSFGLFCINFARKSSPCSNYAIQPARTSLNMYFKMPPSQIDHAHANGGLKVQATT